MMNDFSLRFTPTAMALFTKLHPEIKKLIKRALKGIVTSPYSGNELQAELSGYHSFRIKRYRIIYRVNEMENYIDVIHVGHRREIYEQLRSMLQIPQ